MSVHAEMASFFGPRVELKPNDRIVLRRKVVALVSLGVVTPRALQESLPGEEFREIMRELDTLVYLKAVEHNGRSGWASEYHRKAA